MRWFVAVRVDGHTAKAMLEGRAQFANPRTLWAVTAQVQLFVH